MQVLAVCEDVWQSVRWAYALWGEVYSLDTQGEKIYSLPSFFLVVVRV